VEKRSVTPSSWDSCWCCHKLDKQNGRKLLHLVSTSNIISRVEGERLKGLRRFVGYYRGHPDPGNDDDLLLAIILENI
jgi:hypothetical protein